MSARLRFGPFELDPAAFRLRRDGVTVALEPKALDLLCLLVTRAPHVVDKAELFSVVWKDVAVTDNALTRVVAQLRKSLEDDPKSPRYIETVATRGYRFVAPVSEAGDIAAPPVARERPSARGGWVRWAPVGVVALALVVGATWAGMRLAGSGPPRARWITAAGTPDVALLATLRPAQVTAGRGFDGFLSFSPDGRSIAFSSDRSGTLEIYVQSLVPGSAVTALTSNGRQNVQPAWSPDGQYIAFHEMAGDGLWIVPSHGGAARKISEDGSHPAWSPDGRWIAFQTIQTNVLDPVGVPGALGTIGIVDALGRGAAVGLTKAGEPAGPHLSPSWLDATHLVFVAGPAFGGNVALWSTDVSGTPPALMVENPRLSSNYVLAPDRQSVLFVARGTTAIWRLSFPSEGDESSEAYATGLQTAGTTVGHLTFAPDGRHVAWTGIDSSDHIWAQPVSGASGHADALQLTRDLGVRYGLPAPSSDGRVLTVASRPGSAASVFLVEHDSEPRLLATDPKSHSGARWMPGDREVALITDHDGGPGFWALDPQTSRERLLFHLADLPKPPGDSQPSTATPSANIAFTQDFSRLAFAVVKDGRQNLWVAGLQHFRPDGTLVQKTFEREGGSYPAWSPNGQWIAYQCSEGADTHVCVVDARSGARTQLTHAPGQSWVGGWAPDDDGILFAARRNAVWNVASVSRSTGVVRALTHFTAAAGYVRYPRWDPANDRVVFERSEITGRLWSIELPD